MLKLLLKNVHSENGTIPLKLRLVETFTVYL